MNCKWSYFAYLLAFLSGVFQGCGGAEGPGFSVSVRTSALTNGMLKKIQYLDIAFFSPGKGVTCDNLSPTTYLSDKDPYRVARIPPRKDRNWPVLSLKVEGGLKFRLNKLATGKKLILYVIAYEYDEDIDKKFPLAEACRPNVTILPGKTTKVTLVLEPI